jgi:hypothetical protein
MLGEEFSEFTDGALTKRRHHMVDQHVRMDGL